MNKKRWLDFLAWMVVYMFGLAISLVLYHNPEPIIFIGGGCVVLGLIVLFSWAVNRLWE